MKKEKVIIGKLIKITAGKNHAWFKATIGDIKVKIKKPL